MPYKLTYFDLPALAEPIRLLFILGDIEWKNITPTFDEWAKIKDTTKWGQLPILTNSDNVEMTQSKSILRYLGKKVIYDGMPLYPDGEIINDFEAYKIDEMIDAFEDLRILIIPTYAIIDQAEKEAARLELVSKDGKMYELLKKLEKECGDNFIVCDFLTIADLWVYMLLNFFRCGFYDGIPNDYLSDFPKLTNVINNVKKIPLINKYVTEKASKNDYYKCLL
jgi:prostaglandin-H2 D-isomerase / glutathione transferase